MPKKIALVTCASNYERYGNIVSAMRRELQAIGGYVLYVLSCYSLFNDGMDFTQGDVNIYRLLDTMELDGCIIEANIGSTELTEIIVRRLRNRGIPTLTINLQVPGTPYLHLETRRAGEELMEHLITRHGCTRINLALSLGNRVISQDAMDFYTRLLRKHGIEPDERRILHMPVSIESGRALWERFDRNGVMKDAQAVVCVHDVCAIGLCMEMKDRGLSVPENLLVCSMNFSGNSAAFRPQITGIDRMDRYAAEKACRLMHRMIGGEEIPLDNTYSSTVRYGGSCGCGMLQSEEIDRMLQRVVINKVEAGKQIGQMMRFNDLLEEVEDPDQLADNLHGMMRSVGCPEYFCCLNESAIEYLEDAGHAPDGAAMAQSEGRPFDPIMIAVTGDSERTGRLRNKRFPLSGLIPAECRAGDMVLVMPITQRNRVFGYVGLLNNELPLEVYNYRISQENIGVSIENLHRQMALRNRNAELDRLHMQDPLTGLFNRFALKRFAVPEEEYTVAMLDLDGLKMINDSYGHLAGNHAISMTAKVIRESVREDDLVIRYGGDEFLVLSRHTEKGAWENLGNGINRKLAELARRQELPYVPGVSIGIEIARGDVMDNIGRADRKMYENKKSRKLRRKEADQS